MSDRIGGRCGVHLGGRWTSGRLVALDTSNGEERLWVAFDDRCLERSCAFAFVASAGGSEFRLAQVPDNPIYDELDLYGRDWAISRELTQGYVESLAEPNQVYLGRSYKDAVITVRLQVIERYKPRRVNVQRKRGAEDGATRFDLVSERNE